jgi:hypothetical protein
MTYHTINTGFLKFLVELGLACFEKPSQYEGVPPDTTHGRIVVALQVLLDDADQQPESTGTEPQAESTVFGLAETHVSASVCSSMIPATKQRPWQ